MKSRPRTIGATCALLLCTRIAAADPDASQRALATQLFDDAERLIAAARPTDACPKYAESQRLDPQLGTLLHLAVCYQKVGKTASAWASFKDAAELAALRHDEREAAARQYIADLEPMLSRVILDVAPNAPTGVEIRTDGEPLGRAAWGSAMPIDPGRHLIQASCPGFKDWQTAIAVPAGASAFRVSVPPLEPIAAPVNVLPPATAGEPAAVVDASRRGPESTQRTWGYVLGGVGVVGLGIGAVAGLSLNATLSERDRANACSETASCTSDDRARIDQLTGDARHDATLLNIGLIAGGAALIGGAVLVLTAPSRQPVPAKSASLQPWLASNAGGLSMGGVW